jgi:hypothetical protein
MAGVVRSLWIGCLVLAASCAIGAGPAAAQQTYTFDFSGTPEGAPAGSNALSFVATITGTNCTPDCVISSGTGTLTVGAGTDLTPGMYTFSLGGNNLGPDNEFAFGNAGANNGIDGNGGVEFQTTAVVPPGTTGTAGLNTFELGGPDTGFSGGANSETSVDITYLNNTNSGTLDQGSQFTTSGTLTYSEEAAPAPVVGGGIWSWLALGVAGIAGVAVRREGLSAWARASIAKVARSGH